MTQNKRTDRAGTWTVDDLWMLAIQRKYNQMRAVAHELFAPIEADEPLPGEGKEKVNHG